ncbi:MAG: glycosyltransferase family 4 protein [bacterium]|nr:glycosyltransferase family 4 protein [bacterium]
MPEPGTGNGRRVLVIGPMPPPVHGMSAVTAEVADRLTRRFDTLVADTSPGSLVRGMRYHARKCRRVLRAARIMSRAGGGSVYLPCDARWGLLYTTLLTGLARLLGRTVFLHHHSFAYINDNDARMRVMTRAAGPTLQHVFLCPCMARRFSELYGAETRSHVLSNAAFYDAGAAEPRTTNAGLRVGHLSNLCSDKGLDIVLDTFRELAQRHPDARLVLAGPADSGADRARIEDAREEFGERLDYRGPVYAADKQRFYRDIDVFVFPTRYFNEAQPLVLLEALSVGIPVVSYSRGCIADIVGDTGGRCFDSASDFVGEALPVLDAWARDRSALERASSAAADRFAALHAEGQGQLAALLDRIGA